MTDRNRASLDRFIRAQADLEEAVAVLLEELRGLPQDDPDRAALSNDLSLRMSAIGRRPEALKMAQEAVRLYRALADVGPDAFLPDLGRSLNNLGNRLADVGRREEALAVAQEAVAIRRVLADSNPDAFLPDLAGSLNNLGNRLHNVGCYVEALSVAQEAAQIYRSLADTNPGAFLPGMAMSLNNLATFLSLIDRHEEALAVAQEAVERYRVLTLTNREAFLPDLAMSLNNHANYLADAGFAGDAARIAEEAVLLFRELTETDRRAYLPGLAMSLENLGAFLSATGRHQEETVAREQSTHLRRELVEANPTAYLPDPDLLRTQLEVVPFMGRSSELDRLRAWRDGIEELVSVFLLSGGAGEGKSRLAGEFSRKSAELGWEVLQIVHGMQPDTEAIANRPRRGKGTLAVIDYAETWAPADLLNLVERLRQIEKNPTRILLLARPAGRWWKFLRTRMGESQIATASLYLEPLGHQVNRVQMFKIARDAFARASGVLDASTIMPPIELEQAEGFDHVLAVHIAALSAVRARREDEVAYTEGGGASHIVRSESDDVVP